MKKYNVILASVICAISLSGCGAVKEQSLESFSRPMYQKNEYKVAEVMRGDVAPSVSLTLKPENVEKINYTVDENGLEVEEILVGVGERVKAGQMLISFQSEDLKKSIAFYSGELTKKQLLLDHYSRMYDLDDSYRDQKYAVILEKLKDDVALAKLYLEEERERYNNCQLVAQKDGTISYISKNVMSGFVAPAECLVTELCGQNLFSANTRDDYNFQIGDVYSANYHDDSCDMKVVDIIEEDDRSRTIFFEPTEMLDVGTTDTLHMQIQKQTLKGVVYVDKRAICKKEQDTFVYVQGEEGFLDAVYVEPGEEIDGMVVIRSGLNGTEKVVIK